mmetsp:Transcript_117732/g.204995  ORF Transcript_117732/g.204995 Transcript_117732/m.204995 type:complete len:237 (-) Transcript_117732:692-1402(-)
MHTNLHMVALNIQAQGGIPIREANHAPHASLGSVAKAQAHRILDPSTSLQSPAMPPHSLPVPGSPPPCSRKTACPAVSRHHPWPHRIQPLGLKARGLTSGYWEKGQKWVMQDPISNHCCAMITTGSQVMVRKRVQHTQACSLPNRQPLAVDGGTEKQDSQIRHIPAVRNACNRPRGPWCPPAAECVQQHQYTALQALPWPQAWGCTPDTESRSPGRESPWGRWCRGSSQATISDMP